MEIFIKADDKTHKINWLSSIPDKYKEDILRKVKEQVLLNEKSQYKLSSAPKNSSRRRRSQEPDNRNMTEHELAKLKGLLGFQGANYVDKPSKEGGETYEVILNIKANRSPKKNHKSSQPNLSKKPSKEFLSQYVTGISSQKTLDNNKLPNLLRNANNEIANDDNIDNNDFASGDSRNLDQANADSKQTFANSITDKTSMINLRNMTINSLRNTYCVQYMGINDDRLEVLTRRVLFDKNYKQAQAARKYFSTNSGDVITYERKPHKLAPIYKEPEVKFEEPDQEPIIEFETEPEPQPEVEVDKPEPEVPEPNEDIEEDEPPVARVTRPKDDREDFIIPIEALIPDDIEKPHPKIINTEVKECKAKATKKDKKNKSSKKKSMSSKPNKSETRKEQQVDNKSKPKEVKEKLPKIESKQKKSKPSAVNKSAKEEDEGDSIQKVHSKSSASLVAPSSNDKKKIIADIGRNLEFKTKRTSSKLLTNTAVDSANPYQSIDSPNFENPNEENKQESEGMLANSIGIELSSVKEGLEDSQYNNGDEIQYEADDVIMPRPDKWDKYVVNSYVRPKGLHALK